MFLFAKVSCFIVVSVFGIYGGRRFRRQVRKVPVSLPPKAKARQTSKQAGRRHHTHPLTSRWISLPLHLLMLMQSWSSVWRLKEEGEENMTLCMILWLNEKMAWTHCLPSIFPLLLLPAPSPVPSSPLLPGKAGTEVPEI